MKNLLLIIVLLMTGCGLLHPQATPEKPQLSIQSITVAGDPVEQVQPGQTMDRWDVPVGVDPDEVMVHVEDLSSGEEAWVVDDRTLVQRVLNTKKPRLYKEKKKNQQAEPSKAEPTAKANQPADGLKLDVAKPSYTWAWWLAGSGLLVLVVLALLKYVPFLKPIIRGLDKAAEPIANRVGEVAGDLGSGAISKGGTCFKRVWLFVKRLVRKEKGA